MKKIKSVLSIYILFIFIFLFLLNVNGKEIASMQENDNIFSELKYNIDKGKSIFTLNNNIKKLKNDSLSLKFNELKGKIISYDIKIWGDCVKNRKEMIYTTKKICNPINKSCHIKKILDYIITHNETYKCWKKIDYIPIGINDYKIDNVKFLYENGKYEIDWIPILETDNKIYTQSKWAWWNTTFINYRNITIKGSNSLLINFPILIHLNDTTNMNNNGNDIRFIDLDGSVLSHEIEKFEINDSDIWVKIPFINTTNKTIKMYYNNKNISDGSDAVNVWNNNYTLIHHLNDGIGFNVNSSTDSHHGTLIQNDHWVNSGKIGGTYNWDGIDDVYIISNHADLNPIGNYTWSFWIYFDTYNSQVDGIICKRDISNNDLSTPYNLYVHDINPHNNDLVWTLGNGGDPPFQMIGTDFFNVTTWIYVTITIEGTTAKIYKNGKLFSNNTFSGTRQINGASVYIGQYYGYSSNFLDGKIDEIRFSNSEARSLDWINYTYQNIENQPTFIRINTEENFIIANTAPLFNYSIPNFTKYIYQSINYSNYYYDTENDNISINSSCNILNVSIIDQYLFNIYYYPMDINITYCNLTICDYRNCTISNNFYIDIISVPLSTPYNYAFLDLRERNNIYLMGILIMIYVFIIIVSIYSGNIIIKSFGVLLGITIGIIFFQIHQIIFLLFVFKNILIWLYT